MQKYWYILAVKVVNELWWNFYGRDVNLGVYPINLIVDGIKNDTNISLTTNCSGI